MRFAAVQFDIVWEDKAANHAIIERMLRAASPAIAPGTFVLLPELGDTGFSMNLDRIVDGDQSLTWAKGLARGQGIYVQHGFAQREAAHIPGIAPGSGIEPMGRNCAAILAPDGSELGIYEKIHPFSYGKESLHYSGGEHVLLAHCGDAIVCPMICYDLRFPELWRLAALAGAEVFTIGANWPAARQHHWRALVMARAIENQAYIVAANRIGSDPHLQYGGGSIIVSPKGDILAEAVDRAAILQADLDLEALRRWREEFPALRDVHRDLLGAIEVRSESLPI